MKFRNKIVAGAMSCALALQVFLVQPVTVRAADSTLSLNSQENITSGAVLKKYVWNTTRNNQAVMVNADVIEVDLTNPNVKLDAMAGTQNQFTKKQTVSGMVKDTGAVAGINGDFYNTQAEGVPEGPQVTSGQLMATPPKIPGLYSFAITKDNKPVIDLFAFKGAIIAKDGASYELGGVNKTYYWYDDGTHSHIDGLFMYTNAWGQIDRSNDGVTTPTEVLVQNGVIKEIAANAVLQMIAPKDGYILRAAGKAADFVVQHFKVGDKLTANYEMIPQRDYMQYDTKNFKMMIGGNTILVVDGQPSYFTREITGFDGYRYRSRTAIGYSKDEKTVYLITADNSGTSKGMSIPELQQFMISVGVWKGMVLDGGGSTQMVARPLGEFDAKVVSKLENGVERRVVNGVGVFSTAPKGEVYGLILKGQNELFINESSTYQIKAYDQYYNPVASDAIVTQWTSSQAIGVFKEQVFTATKAGTTKLTAASGKGSASLDVEVIGRDQIASMKINAGDISLSEGGSFKLPVAVTTKSGKTREIPAQLVQWEMLGIQGEIKDGTLKVAKLSGSPSAQLIARYDGYSTMLTLPIGQEKLWYDLDTKAVLTTSTHYPNEVKAAAGIGQTSSGNKNLELTYDFTQGKGTTAAYAIFNDNAGVQIEGEPQYIKAKVLGDGSMNWLRAEFADAAGKVHRVDFTQNMNWTGWQQVTANLTDYNMKYPVTLKSIYVANPEQGHDERALKGKISFDDVTFVYKGQLAPLPKSKVKLTVNQTTVSLNDKTLKLEQAPVIIQDNTLIPIRFVTEALGGTVRWDDSERKVTIIRGDKLIDLWVDNPDLLMGGERVTAEVAPRIMNNLTMVPLRLISERLGWKVGWEPQGQVITLE